MATTESLSLRFLDRLTGELNAAIRDYRAAERRSSTYADDVRGRCGHGAADTVYRLCRLLQAERAINEANRRVCRAEAFLVERGYRVSVGQVAP